MEGEIKTVIDFIQSIGFIGLLIVLAVPRLRKILFNGNGDIKKEIAELKSNHFHSLEGKLDKIIEYLIRIDSRIK